MACGNCTAGCDYPLFFNTKSNSYGKQIEKYFDKAQDLQMCIERHRIEIAEVLVRGSNSALPLLCIEH